MRQIMNIETGKHYIVEDQVACDLIADGKAVPSIEQGIEQPVEAAPVVGQVEAEKPAK